MPWKPKSFVSEGAVTKGRLTKDGEAGSQVLVSSHRPRTSPRHAANKLVRRNYWLELNDRSLVMAMTTVLAPI